MALETTFTEVPCQRSVAGDAFPRGVQDYNWGVSAPTVWFPSESYFRVDVEVYGPGAGTVAPKMSDQIALAEQAVSNAFTNAYFRAGGQVVSSITNQLPQAAAVACRTGKSWAQSKSVGGAFGLTGSLTDRIAAISVSPSAGQAVGTSGQDENREETYKPCRTKGAATLAAPIFVKAADSVDGIVASVNAGIILTSGADNAGGGLATAFQDGVADAGIKIVLGGRVFTIVSVATAGDATLVQSITCSGVWGGAAIGATADWYAVKRNTATNSQARHKIQVMWRPPLGVFQYSQPIGAGQYRFSLSPDPNYRLTMIETLDKGFALTGADSRFKISIADVKFYASVGKLKDTIPDAIHTLDLPEYSVLSKKYSKSLQFTIPQSSEVLYLALQSPKAGFDPAFPPNLFVTTDQGQNNLDLLQVTFANQTQPQTRWDSAFDASQNALEQFYYSSLQATMRADRPGGAESFEEWLRRGCLYAFRFARDENARDTEVQLTLNMLDPAGGTFDQDTNVFLISEYRKLTRMTHSGGMVTEVVSLNA